MMEKTMKRNFNEWGEPPRRQLTRTIDKQVPTAAHYLFPATSSTLLQITRYLSLPSLFPVLVLRVFFKCFFKQTPGSHAIKKSPTASVTIVTGIKTFMSAFNRLMTAVSTAMSAPAKSMVSANTVFANFQLRSFLRTACLHIRTWG